MFCLSYERRHRVLLAQFIGVFSSQDIAELDSAVLGFIDRHGPVHGVLDFAATTAVAVPQTKLAHRARQPPFSPRHRRIIVAPREDLYEAARSFVELQAAADQAKPEIVSSLEMAFALLGLGDDVLFEPV